MFEWRTLAIFNRRNVVLALGMAAAVALTAGALIASTVQRDANNASTSIEDHCKDDQASCLDP